MLSVIYQFIASTTDNNSDRYYLTDDEKDNLCYNQVVEISLNSSFK